VVLLLAGGATASEAAERTGYTATQVGRIRARFLEEGVSGILDRPKPGRPPALSGSGEGRVASLLLETPPRASSTWSTRAVARRVGVSHMTIHRLLKGMEPPQRAGLVGLYLSGRVSVAIVEVGPGASLRHRTLAGLRHALDRMNRDAGAPGAPGKRSASLPDFARFLKTVVRNHRDRPLRVLVDAPSRMPRRVKRWLDLRPSVEVHHATVASFAATLERWLDDPLQRATGRSVAGSIGELARRLAEHASAQPLVWIARRHSPG
jgi:transposase